MTTRREKYAILRVLCPELTTREAAQRAGYASTPPSGAQQLARAMKCTQSTTPTAQQLKDTLTQKAERLQEQLADVQAKLEAVNLWRRICREDKPLQRFGLEAAHEAA